MSPKTSGDTHTGNIQLGNPGSVTWQPGDPNASLARLLTYVESEADKATAWYWRNKRWKARCSRLIQISALILTALAGLFPVVAYLLKQMRWPYPSESGLWSSLFVGIAAALIGLNRTFGLSSGWTRYVLTATSIRKLLDEFRMDCALLLCKTGQNATPDEIATVVQRAKDFRLAVENAVLQETKDWATEFQNSVAQLEKEVKAQVDALKSELEKTKQGEAATASGSIELAIVSAQRADDGKFQILLEGKDGRVAEETLEATKKWVRIGIAPGHYRVTVQAAIGGKSVSTAMAVIIKAGEIAK